jgi:hypothetical protein
VKGASDSAVPFSSTKPIKTPGVFEVGKSSKSRRRFSAESDAQSNTPWTTITTVITKNGSILFLFLAGEQIGYPASMISTSLSVSP